MDKRQRYAATEKGKAARERAQAKRQAKRNATPKKKRMASAKAYRNTTKLYGVPVYEWIAMSEGERNAIVEQHNAENQHKPISQVQAVSTESSREKQCSKLARLFEPKRGFLTKETRDAVHKIIALLNPLHDDIVKRLAKEFLSGRPIERWLKPLDVLRYGDSDSYEYPKLHLRVGDTCTSIPMPTMAVMVKARVGLIVADLRERKTQREAALLQCLRAIPKKKQRGSTTIVI